MSRPEVGEIIEINMDPTGIDFIPRRAKVLDLLSAQFTAEFPDTHALSFRFYADEGDQWRKL